jgi:hypothetical protein
MVGPMRRVMALALFVLLVPASSLADGPKKAPAPAPKVVVAVPLVVVEATGKPRTDYEAETYSGVRLDDPYAQERGVGKGLVYMVFEKQRRAAFRVPHERIRKIVRFVADEVAPVMLVKTDTGAPPVARMKIDVLDTEDGAVAVETVTTNAGIFTTSDVYVFTKGSSLDQRVAALGAAPAVSRERLRRALAQAERTPSR